MSDHPTTHVVIPDTQCRPGVPTDHLSWIGSYIWDQFHGRPNVKIIHLGDNWDMPSFSTWNGKGSLELEGRRVTADLAAGEEGLRLLREKTDTKIRHARESKKPQWHPEWYLLRGNHEDRVRRAIEVDPKWEGFLSDDNFASPGWSVSPFLRLLWLDGVAYSHYFYQPMTGRPHTGTIDNRLKAIGHSFTMGHQQTKLTGERYVGGVQQRGLVCGACYLHNEEYKGPQGNFHWRGILVCHQVENGAYDLMEVSLDWLCRKYEGVPLAEFMQEHYGGAA